MLGLPLAFTYPLVLAGLLLLPVIWYLLKLTPPKPQQEIFPPLVILEKLKQKEETPAKSPWWLTLLRLFLCALLILAMAGPILNPNEKILKATGPLLLVIDDGWASGANWQNIDRTARQVIKEASEQNRLVTLLRTTNPANSNETSLESEDALSQLSAQENLPIRVDHAGALIQLRKIITKQSIGEVVLLSDGLEKDQTTPKLYEFVSNTALPTTLVNPDITNIFALGPVSNNPGKMTGSINRATVREISRVSITGYDKDGIAIARDEVSFNQGTKSAEFEFDEPVELRNQIVRVVVDKSKNAGAVQLLDDGNRRRVVGLVSGQSADISQPLLSPLYYINRALSPFSDIRQSDTSNLVEATSELINQNVSAIVMADIGNISSDASTKLTEWVVKGGMLVRFAGPRLAANTNADLLPVELVNGDRFIGGTLSWETPKEIAPFERGSPFFGLPKPKGVVVSRQVLAVQSHEVEELTWARLEDGTPLVTARQVDAGWLVLFHVNSDNNWSNLPLSGTFVEMLRRTVNLSRSVNAASISQESVRLPPLEILNGKGLLAVPTPSIKPLIIKPNESHEISIDNPPGLYGTSSGYLALNLMQVGESLTPLNTSALANNITQSHYATGNSFNLKPWLLVSAVVLFILDCLAMLWFAGLFKLPRPSQLRNNTAALVIMLAASLVFTYISSNHASAQETDELDYSATLVTKFAYVKTGVQEVDRISAAGLYGLTRYVSSRTSLEPGQPVGLDISKDELVFYPFLYWPIHPDSQTPSDITMARIDAYMKQGGSILFDTRNQNSAILSGGSNSSESFKLREIMASLDIPPLEPVPQDHVLTKAFFLLNSFPGRYQGGDLWVEQIGESQDDTDRPARAGDGVSTILITSNDFAAAWAIDQNDRAIYPTIPPDPEQREYAFRVGVNIVMYTVTGNYKADQVHVPALLERLGQ